MIKLSRCAALAALLISGCDLPPPPPPIPPQFAAAPFMTRAEVALREAPSDTAPTVALLPAGTPLMSLEPGPLQWKVESPSGPGWLYIGYISPRTP